MLLVAVAAVLVQPRLPAALVLPSAAALLVLLPPHRTRHCPPLLQLSSGLTFEDSDGLLVSVQKPLGAVLEEGSAPGTPCVVAVLESTGNAAQAGVREGDRLLAVNNQDVSAASFEQVMQRLQAAPRVVNLRFARAAAAASAAGADGAPCTEG